MVVCACGSGDTGLWSWVVRRAVVGFYGRVLAGRRTWPHNGRMGRHVSHMPRAGDVRGRGILPMV